jgi:GNAT superfamily N-acetyltransferase
MESAYRGVESQKGWTSEDHLIDGPRTSNAEMYSMLSNPNSYLLVASDDTGSIIGCAGIDLIGDHTNFGKFAVDPGRQGGGLGKQLLEAAEAAAISHFGVNKMTMTVIDGRVELEAFYERRGYRRNGHQVFMRDIHSGEGMTRGLDLVLNEYEKMLV